MLKRVFHIIFIAIISVTFVGFCYWFYVEYIKMLDPANDILEGFGLFFVAIYATLIISGEIGIWRSLYILLFERKSILDIVFCSLMIVFSCGIVIPISITISGAFVITSKPWSAVILSCFGLLLISGIIYLLIKSIRKRW